MKTVPVTPNCLRNFDDRIHVCFGISPFNSYFSEARIQQLAEWGMAEFKQMHFFVPDVPSAYTLEALGYEPSKAEWKAKRQCQYLNNKILRALSNIGISKQAAQSMLLNWETLSTNECYLKHLEDINYLFEHDDEFQNSCLDASKWVLEKRVPDIDCLTPDVLRSAVRYLIAEIPLFVDSAGIVGQASSIFSYHQCPSFIERLIRGDFPYKAKKAQGFVKIIPPDLNEQEVISNLVIAQEIILLDG